MATDRTGNYFAFLTDAELEEIVNPADSQYTKKQIRYAVGRLETFAIQNGTNLGAIQSSSVDEIDRFLKRFFAGLRTGSGDLYQKKTVTAIRYGIHRYFLSKKDIDITSRPFKESNKTYKAMLTLLKSEGKGNAKHTHSVSEEDMLKIVNSLDITTPEGLQNKVFIDIMVYFANLSREHLRSMSVSDFKMATDSRGLRYIHRADTMEKFSGVMYEIPCSSRCPVSTFLSLKEKLNPDRENMWQRPKPVAPVDGSPWFIKSPLGVNTIGNKMKDIAEKAGCSRKYTNSSLRATKCTLLDGALVSTLHPAVSVKRHDFESPLEHCFCTTDKKKIRLIADLANKTNKSDVEAQRRHYQYDSLMETTHSVCEDKSMDFNEILPVQIKQETEDSHLEAETTSATNQQEFLENVSVQNSQNGPCVGYPNIEQTTEFKTECDDDVNMDSHNIESVCGKVDGHGATVDKSLMAQSDLALHGNQSEHTAHNLYTEGHGSTNSLPSSVKCDIRELPRSASNCRPEDSDLAQISCSVSEMSETSVDGQRKPHTNGHNKENNHYEPIYIIARKKMFIELRSCLRDAGMSSHIDRCGFTFFDRHLYALGFSNRADGCFLYDNDDDITRSHIWIIPLLKLLNKRDMKLGSELLKEKLYDNLLSFIERKAVFESGRGAKL